MADGLDFSGVFVFGDSLVDPGNALKAARFLDDIPFVSLPNGAPTAEKGYFEGRFSDGYNFADLVSNKLLLSPTASTFPYGFEDPLLGVPIPGAGRPQADNLSFAYGGARAIQGGEVVPDLDMQTDAYRHLGVDPGALHIITIGGNDVRNLVPTRDEPVTGARAAARLSAAAEEIAQEVRQLFEAGARHVLLTGVPDVGLVPAYNGSIDEAGRRSLASQYSETLDNLAQTAVGRLPLPAGGKLYRFDLIQFSDAIVADPDAYNLSNLTEARTTVQKGALDPTGGGFLFFDAIHPSAQVHALAAAEILDGLARPGAAPAWSAAPQIGAQALGSLGAPGGADGFTASLGAGRTYVFDLLGVSSGKGSLADPILRVVDGAGAIVAQDDDGGLGLDPHLAFVAPASGDYSIQAAGVGVAAGSYRLQGGDATGSNLLLTGELRGSDVTVIGGQAADTIAAEAGANYLRGAEGGDLITGGAGFDDINGGMGDDTLRGGPGDDWVVGGKDNDLQGGDGGGDIVWGNLGNDTLNGGEGADQVRGGQGDDRLDGGGGDDYVSGDLGFDFVTGGAGADLFHTFGDAGVDRVLDFRLDEGDRVLLDPGTSYTLSQLGADTVVDMAGGGRMILVDVQLSALPSGWIFGA